MTMATFLINGLLLCVFWNNLNFSKKDLPIFLIPPSSSPTLPSSPFSIPSLLPPSSARNSACVSVELFKTRLVAISRFSAGAVRYCYHRDCEGSTYQEETKRQRVAKEFADMKYQRQLSSTRSSTRYIYHSQSKERESDSECCTLLRKMLSFSNGWVFAICTKYGRCSYFEADSRFQTFTQPYNLQNMNQAGLVRVLTLRLDGGALLYWYNFSS